MDFGEFMKVVVMASIQEFGKGQAFEAQLGQAKESDYIVKDVGLSKYDAIGLSCAVEEALDTLATKLPVDFTFREMQTAMNIP